MTTLMTKTTLSSESTFNLRIRTVCLTMTSESQQQQIVGRYGNSIPRLTAIEAVVTTCWSIGAVTSQVVGALTAWNCKLLSCIFRRNTYMRHARLSMPSPSALVMSPPALPEPLAPLASRDEAPASAVSPPPHLPTASELSFQAPPAPAVSSPPHLPEVSVSSFQPPVAPARQ